MIYKIPSTYIWQGNRKLQIRAQYTTISQTEGVNMNITLTDGISTQNLTGEDGATLYEVINSSAGNLLHTPCGGKGTCGKCRIYAIQGEFSPPTSGELKALTQAELDSGLRLACLCRASGDVVVKYESKKEMLIQTTGLAADALIPDTVEIKRVALEKPTLENPLSVEANLRRALDMPELQIDYALINRIQSEKAMEMWVVLNDNCLLDVSFADEKPSAYALAVDIGTSTVAMYLLNLTDGTIIDVTARENPQRAFGADVISRINHIIEDKAGLENQTAIIMSALDDMSTNICEKNSVAPDKIYYACITGNTIMQHIAAGLDPSGIANAPFIAGSLFDAEIPCARLGLKINPQAQVYFPLCFASYVGGDIATGILASKTDTDDETRIFLDVGTNGEIALKKDGKLTLCATAAGPAFEGAHIKKGTAGIQGAINRVWIEDGEVRCETIGNAKPIGICGSGIIDAVAVMLSIGAIDETGRIVDDDELEGDNAAFTSHLGEADGDTVFYIDKTAQIYITQKDIREIQLAKSAVCAGILTLLDHTGTSVSEVKSLILAGGFGAHMNPSSACKIGLIPSELERLIIPGGNTAGMGAVACALTSQSRARITAMGEISQYLELSGNPYFMDVYIEKMMFE